MSMQSDLPLKLQFIRLKVLFNWLQGRDSKGLFLDNKKAIFIHIPKTASSSIRKILNSNDDKLYSKHRIALNLFYENKQKFTEYYSFAFVRNPFDRLVSAYFYLKSKENKCFTKKYLEKYSSFKEFVKYFFNRNNIKKQVHLWPQYWFVCGPNKHIIIDYVGRYEAINDDFTYISKRISNETRILPHINRSKHKNWKFYYNSEIANIVYNAYQEDFTLFGYSKDSWKNTK